MTADQVATVVGSEKFRSFGPDSCGDCGHRGNFRRRLFEIVGARDDEVATDKFHGLMRMHMKRRHDLDNIFFRTADDRHYIDTAFCEACGSNIVVFDLKLTPEGRRRLFSPLVGHRPKRESD